MVVHERFPSKNTSSRAERESFYRSTEAVASRSIYLCMCACIKTTSITFSERSGSLGLFSLYTRDLFGICYSAARQPWSWCTDTWSVQEWLQLQKKCCALFAKHERFLEKETPHKRRWPIIRSKIWCQSAQNFDGPYLILSLWSRTFTQTFMWSKNKIRLWCCVCNQTPIWQNQQARVNSRSHGARENDCRQTSQLAKSAKLYVQVLAKSASGVYIPH